MTLKTVQKRTILKGGRNAIPYSRRTVAEGTPTEISRYAWW